MRRLTVTCDGCGATETTQGEWPNGWYLWMQREFCPVCAFQKSHLAADMIRQLPKETIDDLVKRVRP